MHEVMRLRLPTVARPLRSSFALVACVAAAACGVSTNVRNPFDGSLEQAREDRLRIQVQNMNFNDATVYAVSSGQRTRLGNVTGKTDSSFRLEWNYANPISFQIDIVGGGNCRTQPIPVDAGARIWVQIPNEVGMSQCRSGRG